MNSNVISLEFLEKAEGSFLEQLRGFGLPQSLAKKAVVQIKSAAERQNVSSFTFVVSNVTLALGAEGRAKFHWYEFLEDDPGKWTLEFYRLAGSSLLQVRLCEPLAPRQEKLWDLVGTEYRSGRGYVRIELQLQRGGENEDNTSLSYPVATVYFRVLKPELTIDSDQQGVCSGHEWQKVPLDSHQTAEWQFNIRFCRRCLAVEKA